MSIAIHAAMPRNLIVIQERLRPRPRTPETRDQKPETRNQRPETRDQKPETRDQKPETREAAQFIRALRDSELKATGEAGKRQKENQKMKCFRIRVCLSNMGQRELQRRVPYAASELRLQPIFNAATSKSAFVRNRKSINITLEV